MNAVFEFVLSEKRRIVLRGAVAMTDEWQTHELVGNDGRAFVVACSVEESGRAAVSIVCEEYSSGLATGVQDDDEWQTIALGEFAVLQFKCKRAK